jgi:hypothetical protein
MGIKYFIPKTLQKLNYFFLDSLIYCGILSVEEVMLDCMYLGSAPWDEDCVQVDPRVDYLPALRAECKRYLELLEKKFTSKPEGCSFVIKNQIHEFGTYCEVCVLYNDNDEDETNFAFFVEGNSPGKWDDETELDHRKPKDYILQFV